MLNNEFESTKLSIDTSIRAIARYMHLRIEGADRKKAYLSSVSEFLLRLKSAIDMTEIKMLINDTKYVANARYRNKFIIFSRKEERRLALAACQHIEDVVNSVEMRFVTGGFDPIPGNYKHKAVCLYIDEGILKY